MLVLSRKENESIILSLPNGDTVVVSVVAINGNRVTIGADAPKDVKILRSELQEIANA